MHTNGTHFLLYTSLLITSNVEIKKIIKMLRKSSTLATETRLVTLEKTVLRVMQHMQQI